MPPLSIFGRTKAIERQIDGLLDAVSEQAMAVEAALHEYLATGEPDESRRRPEQVVQLKRRCSELRREVETELHEQMLIPDMRVDVMQLIESVHGLAAYMSHLVRTAHLERPEIPDVAKADLDDLATTMARCVDTAIAAARAFFRNIYAVRDHVHKVGFYESESDAIADRLYKAIFDSDLELAHKLQLRNFVRELDGLSDEAEALADNVNIWAIKRYE